MTAQKKEREMRFGFLTAGKWLVVASAMIAVSTMAQDPKKATDPPTAESSTPARTTQPVALQGTSQVDNKTYVIGESDVLDVDVWKEKEISRAIPVRPDGKISLPLIGEIQASGMTPLQLQDDIAKRLKGFLANPEVTVIVAEPRSHHFNVVGQVARPGTFPLTESMTVLDAIALTGGFRDFAKQTKIYVLRAMPDGTRARLPFNYKDAIKGKNLQNNVTLKPGDTIVVP
jgi:polysaccharide export outer membrane protein